MTKKRLILLILIVIIIVLIMFTKTSAYHSSGEMNNSQSIDIHAHESTPLTVDDYLNVEPGYVKIQVNGFVCELCARKTKKALIMLPFIEDVVVDLDNQIVTIKIKEGKELNLQMVVDAIRKKGFDPYMLYQLDSNGMMIIKEL